MKRMNVGRRKGAREEGKEIGSKGGRGRGRKEGALFSNIVTAILYNKRPATRTTAQPVAEVH